MRCYRPQSLQLWQVEQSVLDEDLSRGRRLAGVSVVVFGDHAVDTRRADTTIEVPKMGSRYWVLDGSVAGEIRAEDLARAGVGIGYY